MKYINTNQLENLKINSENVCMVIDFDKTITAKESDDSWKASGMILDPNFMKTMQELYETYRPIEKNCDMPQEEKRSYMDCWYQGCMDLYYTYELTEQKIKQSIEQSDLRFRKGAKEFLQKAIQEQIPIIILSAGIGNVIKQFLKENDCISENVLIISNFIDFDEKGKMIAFKKEMIHSLNKTMKGHLSKQWKEKIEQKEYKILMGDLIEDEKMVEQEEWNTTLKIGIYEEKTDKDLINFKKHFDLVLTQEDATFEVVNKLVFSV